MADPEVIGTVIHDKYRIVRAVGAGAMGCVYEAEHTGTGRRVAVKLLNNADTRKNAAFIKRFEREARAAGAIDTQHITQVLDVGTDPANGVPYMVMELLVGEDLQQALHRVGPLDPNLALRILAQACLGLQKAHEANVIHRDIKPANIFLAKRDAGELVAKLLDFGIAKIQVAPTNEMEAAALTRTGNILGSPLYMSPEQARGGRQIDHRTDIWSLGVVLYQMLTGRTPYHHATALGELIIAICHEPPPHVQDFAPWVPPEVAAIVHRAVRQTPSERFSTAAEMLEAVRAQLPGGWTLTEDLLVPLSEAVQTRTAGRLSLPSPLELPGATSQASRPERQVSSPDIEMRMSSPDTHISSPGAPARGGSMPEIPGHSSAPSSLPDTDGSGAAMVRSQSLPPNERSGRSAKVIAVAATALVAIVGGGVYALTRSTAGASSAEPTPAASIEPVAAAPLRRVKLVVVPEDVSVEIEGVKAEVVGGIVEIAGSPGSVHRVRVFNGSAEKTKEVIITDAGPSPPKIELKVAAAKPSAAPTAAPTSAKPASATSGFKNHVKKLFSF